MKGVAASADILGLITGSIRDASNNTATFNSSQLGLTEAQVRQVIGVFVENMAEHMNSLAMRGFDVEQFLADAGHMRDEPGATAQENQIKRWYLVYGMTIAELAGETGMKPAEVSALLRRMGLRITPGRKRSGR